MASLYQDFHDGLSKRGWNSEQVAEMWRLIEAQAEYSFNRSHSVAYGLLSYVMAYLKHYKPQEFMTALLISEIGDYEQTSLYIDECNKMGIQVVPPDVNYAERHYTVVGDKIMFGLESLKGVGGVAVEKILEIREHGQILHNEETGETTFINSGHFTSLADFLERVRPDKTTAIALIKSGAFGMNKVEMLEEYAELLYTPLKYSPRKTLPTKKVLIECGLLLDEDDERFKTDKDQLLIDYNDKIKLPEHIEKDSIRKKKHLEEFFESYAGKPEMYEYETMSIFLNGSPFDKYKAILKPFESYEDGTEKILIAGTVFDVEKKKQKGGGQYAYVKILTPYGVHEGMAFRDTFVEYTDLIKKGENVVCLAKKSGTQFIISKMRTLESWLPVAEGRLRQLSETSNKMEESKYE